MKIRELLIIVARKATKGENLSVKVVHFIDMMLAL